MKSCNRYVGIDPYLLSQVRYRARRLSRHSLMQGMEIEDIEQELMLDILARTPSYDPDRAKWSTFVDRVLSNKCATMISTELAAKRGAGVRAISLDALRAEPDRDLHEPVDEASLDRTHLEIRIDLGRHIWRLSPSLSGLLRSLCERTMTEIARDSGLPKATLYGHLAVLRGHLEPLQEYLH
jgi:DNA-directed RNA polymerase specialized sigma24 family protein